LIRDASPVVEVLTRTCFAVAGFFVGIIGVGAPLGAGVVDVAVDVDDVAVGTAKEEIVMNGAAAAAVSVVVEVDERATGRSKWGIATRRIAPAIMPVAPRLTRKEYTRGGMSRIYVEIRLRSSFPLRRFQCMLLIV
jgi:uncharacterized membrane protein YfcA